VSFPSRPKHVGTLLAAPLVLALALSGCAGDSEAGDSEAGIATSSAGEDCPFTPDTSVTSTARIGFQHIPNGDLVVKDLGLLEACMPNAEITWSKFDSGGDVVQAFGSNSVDLGLLGSSPATKALSEPLLIDMQVVWIHDVIGEAESLVVHDKSITDIVGLRGKTIAVPFSSTAHYSLLQALNEAGLDPATDVNVINLSPEAMPSAWQGGQIDAAWVWAPTLQELLKTGKVVLSSEQTAAAGKPTYDLGGATTAFVQANPDFMSVWAKAQDHAVKMIQQEPEGAAVSIAAVLGIPPASVMEQFDGYVYLDAAEQASDDYLGGGLVSDLEDTATFLLQQGGVEAVNATEAYRAGVNPGPAKSAAP
jgi:taurine transport system substrate-binding protein